ncbi:MAG: BREX-6 system BrxE protein [Desulfobacterales bacterium]|nr:BREX-6 system BrxE protein [Desulfobacterales bacterium]
MVEQMEKQDDLDLILALQILVGWAGEGLSEPGRLDWWRTDLVDEEGGGDLFERLFPKTHAWASLEAVRKAAILRDSEARLAMARPDGIRTLFFWGLEMDEKLDERLRGRKNQSIPPMKALPFPMDIYAPFNKKDFEKALGASGQAAAYKITPGGREITQPPPDALDQRARRLAAALTPLADAYPTPFYRVRK